MWRPETRHKAHRHWKWGRIHPAVKQIQRWVNYWHMCKTTTAEIQFPMFFIAFMHFYFCTFYLSTIISDGAEVVAFPSVVTWWVSHHDAAEDFFFIFRSTINRSTVLFLVICDVQSSQWVAQVPPRRLLCGYSLHLLLPRAHLESDPEQVERILEEGGNDRLNQSPRRDTG